MEVPKQCRIVDEELIEKYRKRSCDICGVRPCDPCHIGSRGAGNPDADWNLYSGCRVHHAEQGQLGFFKFCEKYPFFRQVLAAKGWQFDGNKKLRRTEHAPLFREKAFGKL